MKLHHRILSILLIISFLISSGAEYGGARQLVLASSQIIDTPTEPSEQVTSAGAETSVPQGAPSEPDTPPETDISAEQDTPAVPDIPSEPNIPAEPEPPAEPEISTEQEIPSEESVPEQEAPAEELVTEQEPPAEELIPEQEIPAEELIPEQEIPAEELIPEQEIPAEELIPESEIPANSEEDIPPEIITPPELEQPEPDIPDIDLALSFRTESQPSSPAIFKREKYYLDLSLTPNWESGLGEDITLHIAFPYFTRPESGLGLTATDEPTPTGVGASQVLSAEGWQITDNGYDESTKLYKGEMILHRNLLEARQTYDLTLELDRFGTLVEAIDGQIIAWLTYASFDGEVSLSHTTPAVATDFHMEPLLQLRNLIIDEHPVKLTFSFGGVTSENTNPKLRLIKSGESTAMTVWLQPSWSSGRAEDVRVHIRLPYLDPDGNVIPNELIDPWNPPQQGVIGVPSADEAEGWEVENYSLSEHKGELVVNRLFLAGGTSPGFTVDLRFFGDVPENTAVTISGYVEYTSFNGDKSYAWTTGGLQDEDAMAEVVSSNLEWVTDIKALREETVVWDRFNYVPFEFMIENVSDSPDPVIDSFAINLQAPHISVGTYGGIVDNDVLLWNYNPGGTPVFNAGLSNYGQLLTGKPGEGGILVYDVTGLSRGDPLGDPIPYVYTGSGQLTININQGAEGTLHSSERVLTESGMGYKTKKVYRIEIPFPNQFEKLPVELNLKAAPTIYIGNESHEIVISKNRICYFTMVGPNELDMTVEKNPQAEDAYYHMLGHYRIGGIRNPANTPYFSVYLGDNLPGDFELASISLSAGISPEDWFSTGNPVSCEFICTDSSGQITRVWAELPPFSLSDEDDIWELSGIPELIAAEMESLALQYTSVQFENNIQIRLNDRIEPGEELPGELILEGLLLAGGLMANDVNLFWNYQYDNSALSTGPEPQYEIVEKGPSNANAALKVLYPKPVLAANAVEHTAQLLGHGLSVPYKELNGYRFYPGNDSPGIMTTPRLEIKLPVNVPAGLSGSEVINGLLLEEIRISESLLQKGRIDRIVLTDALDSGGVTPSVIDFSSLEPLPSSGDLIIPKALWCPDPDGPLAVNYPNNVVIYYESFQDDVKIDSETFVELIGLTNRYGTLEASGEWLNPILGGGSVTSGIVKESLAIIMPEPRLRASAVYYEHADEMGTAYKFQKIPYGREGLYRFRLWNASASTIKSGEVTLNFQLSPDTLRGFKPTTISIKKGLLDSAEFRYLEIFSYDDADTPVFIAGLGGDGNFYRMSNSESGYELTDEQIPLDDNGSLTLSAAVSPQFIGKLVLHTGAFYGSVPESDDTAIHVYGMLDSNPYAVSSSATSKTMPADANNLATIKWTTELNEGEFNTHSGKTGFLVRAASIDMRTYARHADSAAYGGGYTAQNDLIYERSWNNTDYPSFYTDIGYKAIGSYTVEFNQNNSFENNVKMDLSIETSIPYQQFDMYYMSLSPELRSYLQSIDIYRLDESGTEYLWQTISGTDWQNNGKKTGWFRVNTANRDSDLYITQDLLPSSPEEEHPYYKYPFRSMSNFLTEERVTRVVTHLSINREAALDGKAKAPDFGNLTTGNLIDYTGRFTASGDYGAKTTVTYDFGEGTTLQAGVVPNDTLVSGVLTVASMLDGNRYSSYTYGPGDHWGSSSTSTFFRVKEPTVYLRKGGTDPLNTTTGGGTLSPDTGFGDNKSLYLTIYNGNTVHNSSTNNSDEWGTSKSSFVDKAFITDTLPLPTPAAAGEENPYEGYLPRKIIWLNETIRQGLWTGAGAESEGRLISLRVDMTNGASRTFTPADFSPEEPFQVLVGYSFDDSPPAGTASIDLPAGVFIKSFTFEVDHLSGNGDYSSELRGLNKAAVSGAADIRVDGDVFSTNYQTNSATVTPRFDSGTSGAYPKSDSARFRAVALTLTGGLTLSSNITGNNVYVYNPVNQDMPNTMAYNYDLSNPGQAPIGKLGMSSVLPAPYRLQYIYIPEELIDSGAPVPRDNGLYFTKFQISTPSQTVDVLSLFEHDTANSRYVLDTAQLFSNGTLTPPTPDSSGYVSYRISGIYAEWDVADSKNKEKYLMPSKTLTGSETHDITLEGIYAETLAGLTAWDEQSRATIAKSAFHYYEDAVLSATLTAHSYTKYSNPANTKTTTHSRTDRLYNLVALLSVSYSKTNPYDQHRNKLDIPVNKVLPGDRIDAELRLANTGAAGGINLDLNDPMLRYYVPKGTRIISWALDRSSSSAPDILSRLDEAACRDVTAPASWAAADEGSPLLQTASGTKDLAWNFKGKLRKGDMLVIKLILEITDEYGSGAAYPTVYQGSVIANTGGVYASGGMTHGYRPIKSTGGTETGSCNLDPSDSKKQGLNGIYLGLNQTYTYVSTTAPTLAIKSDTSYQSSANNITGYPMTLTVNNLAANTRHEMTDYAVEVVLDKNANYLQGFVLSDWPVINVPDGLPEALLYYKELTAGNTVSAWTLVNDSTPAVNTLSVYALRWEYGETAVDDTAFPAVQIYGTGMWRTNDVTGTSSTVGYDINAYVNTFFYHNRHEIYGTAFAAGIPGAYASGMPIAGSAMAIGRQANTAFTLLREVPFVEIDNQVFDQAEDARMAYSPNNAARKITYRPGDDFWYKLTVRNKARDANYTNVGTGPLLSPVVFDKIPEYVTLPVTLGGGPAEVDISAAIENGDLEILWYDDNGNLKTPVSEDVYDPAVQFRLPRVTREELRGNDIGGSQRISNYINTNPTVGATVLTEANSREIAYTLLTFDFTGMRLERNERLEIHYRASARRENLPLMTSIINDEEMPVYLPRMGEYVSGQYSGSRVVAPEYGSTPSQPMDGDFLLHDAGVSGTPNPGTPPKLFLSNSLTWIPGYDSASYQLDGANVGNGDNGNLFDYDLQSHRVQQAEFKSTAAQVQSYTNTRYQSYTYNSNHYYAPETVRARNRDMWTLVLKPRTAGFQSLHAATIDGGLENLNIVWSQSRMHLSKAWLYAASQMIPATSLSYEDDGNTYNSAGTYSPKNTYTKDAYTYGAEYNEAFNARQMAVNYGDSPLTGVEFIYVLPRGTAPVFDESGRIPITGYYGDPHTETPVPVPGQDALSYTVLQTPDTPSDPPYYAPKTLMEGRKNASDYAYYGDDEKNPYPWVIKIRAETALTPWWNRNKSPSAGVSVSSYYLFTQFPVKVVTENTNGLWLDELYASAAADESELYTQVYSYDFTRGQTRPNPNQYDNYGTNTNNGSQYPDAGVLGMMTRPNQYNGSYTDYNQDYYLTFYSAQTPYIRGLNYQGRRVRQSTEGKIFYNHAVTVDTSFSGIPSERLYIKNGDVLRARKPAIRLWSDIDDASTAAFFRETREPVFNLNLHLENRYVWAEKPLNSGSNPTVYESNLRNHRTNGGLKGTLFEPVLTNILPYGIVPLDSAGNPLPHDQEDWIYDTSDPAPYTLTVSGLTGAALADFQSKWDLDVSWIATDEAGNPVRRYRLTWTPKAELPPDEKLKLAYGETIDVSLPVKAVAWPENQDLNGETDLSMNTRWQDNRTYLTSLRDVFFYMLEPESSPYLVGNPPRAGITDIRPDSQGVSGTIKAQVLGTLQSKIEADTENIEDYSSRAPILLSAAQRDFNRNGRAETLAGELPAMSDQYVTNTMRIFTKHPRINLSKNVSGRPDIIPAGGTMLTSYAGRFWYHFDISNLPLPNRGTTVNSWQAYEASRGTSQSSYIMVYDWMPPEVSYNGDIANGYGYRISYPDPLDPTRYIVLDKEALEAKGFRVEEVYDNTDDHDETAGHYAAFRITLPSSFEAATGYDQRLDGDLRTMEGFRFSIAAMVTQVGGRGEGTDSDVWTDIENNAYVNIESFAPPEDAQSPFFSDYMPFLRESAEDYNGNEFIGDEFAVDNAFISIRKPAGVIRHDSNKNKLLNTSGSYRSPAYTGSENIAFYIDQVQSPGSDVAELYVVAHGMANTEYSQADASPGDWQSAITSVRTGVWEIPANAIFPLEDYRIYLYASSEDEDFYSLGDQSLWTPFGASSGYGLTENVQVSLPAALQQTAAKVIFVIRSRDPDRIPVPKDIRLAIDADETIPGSEVSDVDPPGLVYDPVSMTMVEDSYKRNFMPYNDSVRNNSILVVHSSQVLGSAERLLYQSAALWCRFSKKSTCILDKSADRIYVSSSNPVLDLAAEVDYFRYSKISVPIPVEEQTEGGPETTEKNLYHWDANTVVNPNYGSNLRYKIYLRNMDQETWGESENYREDILLNPVVINELPAGLGINPSAFDYVPPDLLESSVLRDDYISTQDIGSADGKWSWYLIKKDPDSRSKLRFVESVPAPANPFIGTIPGNTPTMIRWRFEGMMEPGDTLVIVFIANAVSFVASESNQNTLYCFNENGTLNAYTDLNPVRDNGVGVSSDIKDLNQNGRSNDRYVRTRSPGFSFLNYKDYPKAKRAYSDLNVAGTGTPAASAVTEGSVYSFTNSVSNPQGEVYSYEYPVIFDILPHFGDVQTVGTRISALEPFKANSRNSQWSGWIIPESITLREEGGAELLPKSKYQVWVGPILGTGASMQPGSLSDLPDLQNRSRISFFTDNTDDPTGSAIRRNNFVLLSEVEALKATNPDLYERLIKSIRALWVQMSSRNYQFYGRQRLILSFDMQAPLNLPFFNENHGTPGGKGFSDYAGWNSFASWYYDTTLSPGESSMAGVYLDAPPERGYIGDYVWMDFNRNGLQDEAVNAYEDNSRLLPQEWLFDINGDGKPDDPGANGVLVELLTADGFSSDKEGNRVVLTADGVSCIVDENGQPLINEFGDYVEGGTPASYMTTKDYAGRYGYYILSNIKPGAYRLRYTFPKAYKYYGITTPTVHGNTPVTAYGPGMALPNTPGAPPKIADTLVVYTDMFELAAGREDAYYVDFDMGIHMAQGIGGTAWIDYSETTQAHTRNGYLDPEEKRIPGATVSVRNTDGSVARDMLNRPAVMDTDANGKFLFRYLVPGRQYYIVTESNDEFLVYPSPLRHAVDPLYSLSDNDLYHTTAGMNRTNVFTAGPGTLDTSDKLGSRYADILNVGLGYTGIEKSIVEGIVWSDLNRDGFRDTEPGGADIHLQEPGLPGVEIKIRRHKQRREDDLSVDAWEIDMAFGINGVRTVTTDATGRYFFDQLDNCRVTVEEGRDVITLFGYELFIDNLPTGYTPTLRHTWYSDKTPHPFEENKIYYDSDLFAETGKMTVPFVILAQKNESGAYDPALTQLYTGLDAGLVTFDTGSIKGRAWDDQNRNGLQDSGERGLPGASLSLQTFDAGTGVYREVRTVNGQILNFDMTGYATATEPLRAVSGAGGQYTFENLPIANKSFRVPYTYRVVFQKPFFAEWTLYQAGSEPDLDNDFQAESGTGDDCVGYSPDYVLARPLHTASHYGEAYDLLTALHVNHNDLGLVYPTPSILGGLIWDDSNRNGLYDPSERLLVDRNVYLYQYDFDSNAWIRAQDARGVSEILSSDGHYAFHADALCYNMSSPHYLEKNLFRIAFEKKEEERAAAYRVGENTEINSDALPLEDVTPELRTAMGLDETLLATDEIFFEETEESLPESPAHGDITTIHCGLLMPTHYITGYFWKDLNRDGFRDEDEPPTEGQEVKLRRLILSDENWQPDSGFETMTAVTGPDGQYLFEDLPGMAFNALGEMFLYGYEVFVDTLPDGYAPTAPHVRIPEKTPPPAEENAPLYDSDLLDTGLLTINPLVIAAKTGGRYDESTANSVKGINGGLVPFDKGRLAGTAWYDRNENSLKDSGELLLPGVAVYLQAMTADGTYMPVQELNGALLLPDAADYGYGAEVFAVTDDEGGYAFDNLPIADAVTREPYTYRLTTVKEDYAEWCLPNVGNDRSIDNDFYPVDENSVGTSTTVYQPAAPAREPASSLDRYIFGTALREDHLDIGLKFPSRALRGRIWEDANQNGTLDSSEKGLPSQRAALYKLNPDTGLWETERDIFGHEISITDEDGAYEFYVAAAEYDPRSTRYLELDRFRILFEKKQAEAFSKPFQGDDPAIYSIAMDWEHFTLAGEEPPEILADKNKAVTPPLAVAESIYDEVLETEMPDFNTLSGAENVNCGIIPAAKSEPAPRPGTGSSGNSAAGQPNAPWTTYPELPPEETTLLINTEALPAPAGVITQNENEIEMIDSELPAPLGPMREEIQLLRVPQTGDMILWFAGLLFLSGIGTIFFGKKLRKGKDKEE